jgi:hypothetical protein
VVRLLKGGDVADLEEGIDKLLHKFEGGHAFCKLHTRSPKDAVTRFGGPMQPLVQQRMQKTPVFATLRQKRLLANDDANLISTIARELFRVSSGKEVVTLLRASDRVVSDLEKARQAQRGSCLVLRRFSLCVPAYEFRAFVFNRRLTGVSQYCYRQYFPEMLKRRPQLEAAIVAFFDSSMARFPMENFVCDLFVTWRGGDEGENAIVERVEIIELNPWFADTGALLFDWKSEEDRRILRGEAKRNEPEFRYLPDVVEDPYESLPLAWRNWFEKQRKFDLRKT